MKCVLSFLLLAILAPVATGFMVSLSTSNGNVVGSSTALAMTKKFPAGRPYTGCVDEDLQMWYEGMFFFFGGAAV